MRAKQIVRPVLCGGVCVALLAGCSWVKHWSGDTSGQTLTPEPQAKVMQTADATWMEPTDKSAAVAHMVPDQSQGNKDAMKRLDNLEHQVAQMQNDMNTMMPVLSRLVAVQTDIQAMLAKLEVNNSAAAAASGPAPAPPSVATTTTATPPDSVPPASAPTPIHPPATLTPQPVIQPQASATSSTPTATPMVAAAAPQTPAIAAAAMAPAAAPPAVTLSAVRVGEHSGKTRLVIDGSDKLPFSPVIDSATNTLVVDVPGTAWQGSAGEQAIAKSPLLSSWRSEPDGQGGTRIVAQLKKSSKIVLAESLGPANGQPGKIIVDLAAQ